jgi:glycerol-3-phosphate dehydrogenase
VEVRKNIYMPIVKEVNKLLKGKNPKKSLQDLLK